MTNRSKKQDIKTIILILVSLVLLFVGIKLIAYFFAVMSMPDKTASVTSSAPTQPSAISQTHQ